MYYIIFKITNLVTSKFFIGTEVSSDMCATPYTGNQTQLKRDIEKYGWDNFRWEIIASFKNHSEMYEMHRELVDKEFTSSPNTYNIDLGGLGDFYYVRGAKKNSFHPKVPEAMKQCIGADIKKLLTNTSQ